MPSGNMNDIAAKMRGIDIAFVTTQTEGGELASRPMSNNADVDYDGDSYDFTFEKARTVSDIERDAKVSLGFRGTESFYVAVEGEAELIREKHAFQAHWTPDLDKWFEQGIETPGIVLIKVKAHRIKYWDGLESGDVTLHA